MECLLEIKRICGSMDSQKARDRKKVTDRLLILIQRSDVQAILTQNSEAKLKDRNKSLFTWNSVFQYVKQMTFAEIEGMHKAATKNLCSAATMVVPVNRQQKKLSVISLLKLVLQAGNHNKPFLNLSLVIDHALDVFGDKNTLFEAEYCHLLQKYVFSKPDHCVDIKVDIWETMTEFCCRRLADPRSENVTSLAALLSSVVMAMSYTYIPNVGPILRVATILITEREKPASLCVAWLLRCINQLCSLFHVDARLSLLQFGITVRAPLERLWVESAGPSQRLTGESSTSSGHGSGVVSLQIEMVGWWRWMVCLSSGAAGVEGRERLLLGIRECVLQELEYTGERIQRSISGRYSLHEDFYRLAAAVLIQTQSLVNTDDGAAPAKRRRAGSVWDVCMEKILLCNGVSSLWFNVLHHLFMDNEDTDISDAIFIRIVTAVSTCLARSKRHDVLAKCLDFISLNVCPNFATKRHLLTVQSNQSVLQDIWKASTRLLQLQLCPEKCCDALISLLGHRLVRSVNTDFWTRLRSYSPTDCLLQLTAWSLLHLSTNEISEDLCRSIVEWIFPDREELKAIGAELPVTQLRPGRGPSLHTYLLISHALVHQRCSKADSEHGPSKCLPRSHFLCQETAALDVEPSRPSLCGKSLVAMLDVEKDLDPDLFTSSDDALQTEDARFKMSTGNQEIGELLYEVLLRDIVSLYLDSSANASQLDSKLVHMTRLTAVLCHLPRWPEGRQTCDQLGHLVTKIVDTLTQKASHDDRALMEAFASCSRGRHFLRLIESFQLEARVHELCRCCVELVDDPSRITNPASQRRSGHDIENLDIDDLDNLSGDDIAADFEDASEIDGQYAASHISLGQVKLSLLCGLAIGMKYTGLFAEVINDLLSKESFTTSGLPIEWLSTLVLQLTRPDHRPLVTFDVISHVINQLRLALKLHRKEHSTCCRLLDLIRVFAPVACRNCVVEDDLARIQTTFQQLIGLVWKVISTNFVASERFDLALCKATLCLIKIDPSCTAVFTKSIISLATRELFSSRITVPLAMFSLLANEQRPERASFVPLLASVGTDLLRTNEALQDYPVLIQDIWTARVASLLHTWAAVLTAGVWGTEDDVIGLLVDLLVMAVEKEFDAGFVLQILRRVSKSSKSNFDDFRRALLPRITVAWTTKVGRSLLTFPHAMFGLPSLNQLVKSCKGHVILSSVVAGSQSTLETLVTTQGISLDELFIVEQASVLAGLALCGTLQRENPLSVIVRDILNKKQLISPECVGELGPAIVIWLIEGLVSSPVTNSNQDEVESMCRLLDQSLSTILTEWTSDHTRMMPFLLIKADGVERILLHLIGQLGASIDLKRRRCAVLGLSVFLGLLMSRYFDALDQQQPFFVRIVALQLAELLDNERDEKSLIFLLDALEVFLRALITEQSALESDCHNRLVYCLVAIRSEQNVAQTSRCLNCLVIENQTTWTESIKLLDPFPTGLQDIEAARQLNLKSGCPTSAIDRMLQSLKFCNNRSRSFGLDNLSRELSQLHPKDLDQEASKKLSALYPVLLGCTHSKDQLTSTAAAQSLSLLVTVVPPDAADFFTSSLSSIREIGFKEDSEIDPALVGPQFRALVDALNLLTTERCEVVHVISDVLKSVLSVKLLRDSLQKVPFWKDRLGPYIRLPIDKNIKLCAKNENSFIELIRSLGKEKFATHDEWTIDFVQKLIASGMVSHESLVRFAPLCKIQARFASLLLPSMVTSTLSELSDTSRTMFFDHIVGEVLPSDTVSDDLKRTLLAVILNQHKLVQWILASGKQPNEVFLLNCDHLVLAETAFSLKMFHTGLLFLEMGSVSREDFLQDPRVQSVSLQCFKNLNNVDCVRGCQMTFPTTAETRLTVYESEKSWLSLLMWHDQHSTSSCSPQLLSAVHGVGAHNLFHQLADTSSASISDSASLVKARYASAWRMSRWSLEPVEAGQGFEPGLYASLKAVEENDWTCALSRLTQERSALIQTLSHLSVQDSCVLTSLLCQIRCINELQDGLCALQSTSTTSANSLVSALGRSIEVLGPRSASSGHSGQGLLSGQVCGTNFDAYEPLLAGRCALSSLILKQCHTSGDSSSARGVCEQAFLGLASLATTNGRHQISANLEHGLEGLLTTASNEDAHWRCLERLRLRLMTSERFWSKGETRVGCQILEETTDQAKKLLSVVDKTDGSHSSLVDFYITCVALHSDWLGQTKAKSAAVIINDYLTPVLSLANEQGCTHKHVHAFSVMASYADQRYKEIDTYMNSAEFESRQALMREAKEDASCLSEIGDKSRLLSTLLRQTKLDEQELLRLVKDRDEFLVSAVGCYGRCLQLSDQYDLKVFRLVSLWLSNAQHNSLPDLLGPQLDRIRADKFLLLAPQLSARLSQTALHQHQDFQPILKKLLERMVDMHPYHAAYTLLALVHAKRDNDYDPKADVDVSPPSKRGRAGPASGKKAANGKHKTSEDRVMAAKQLLNGLFKGRRGTILQRMMKLCDAYIQWANFDVEKFRRETGDIRYPAGVLLPRIKDQDDVQLPTVDLCVDQSGLYPNHRLVTLVGFQPRFRLPGGINLPKVVFALSSDGVARRQVVKGRDDIRQDAVMQQVFHTVNRLLEHAGSTAHSQLLIRTYRVLPMSQRSGILEWCEDTVPLGEYLAADRTGAHRRYHPRGMQPNQAKARLHAVKDKGLDARMNCFKEICTKLRPVFGYFFLEHFLNPNEWYNRREAYIRSAATNSMVGYVLGLGDRHPHNILIDTNTAELIHIDLGVAFDQGKILPTPEAVPFRLTRDLVHGMGMLGVEGTFRCSCARTLEVLRKEEDVICTIVEVLLHDPLYTWTLSPKKAYLLQAKRAEKLNETNMSTTSGDNNVTLGDTTRDCIRSGLNNTTARETDMNEVNRLAERVLLCLRRKLTGHEAGGQLNVDGQVNYLLQMATDPDLLGRMYFGWQAYL